MRCKNGNPKKQSRFICLHCMRENMLGFGVQRVHEQREKYHIKDLHCINPECRDMEITKNIEVRWCDNYEEVYKVAKEIRDKYYLD